MEYLSYNEIPEITVEYLLTLSGENKIEDIELKDINDFFEDLNAINNWKD